MKKFNLFLLLLTLFFVFSASAGNDLDNFLDIINKSAGNSTGLSNDKIVQGLTEALKVGTGNAVNILSKTDGFFKNPKVKIPYPKEIAKVENIVRMAGFGDKLDALELSMNRAAEKAAPAAKKLFVDAISHITFNDARKILKGRDNEATLYFKGKMSDQLARVFRPIIHDTMAKTGVTKNFQAVKNLSDLVPVSGFSNLNIDDYVTEKALDGLFTVISDEERKIRKDPAARISRILKEVFGN